MPGHDGGEIKTDPNRVVYLAFTSGTTGTPKGVMHSDNTLLANARAIAADWAIDAQSVVYSLSPLSHNLGFGAMVMALAAGGELVIHDLPRGASLIDRVIETGTSFLVGVPTHAIDLLRELRERGLKGIGRLKGFRISGAAAPREVVAQLIANGVMPQSGYGMTETCSHQYTLPTDDASLIIETCGKACPGYELKIWQKDDPDVEAATGEIGQIGGRGASLMLGYFDDQAATEAAFNAHGWFMTGDLGWIDERGYLRITGRKKDVIIRGGHNIFPARIEDLAMRHPAVERVAAVPVADPRLGEKVCLAVMWRAGARAEPAEMLAHLAAMGLSKYDMPEYVLELDHIPLTPSGKLRKRDIVDWIAQGRAVPAPVRVQAGDQVGNDAGNDEGKVARG
jgi:acyl-CoA synthetase